MTSDRRPIHSEGYGYAIEAMLKVALIEMKRINKILNPPLQGEFLVRV